jgi:hypothetical protein
MSYDSTIEDLVDNVHSFVESNVPTYVTEINSAKADGVMLTALRNIEISDTDPYAAGIYPRLQLFVENLEIEYLSSGYDAAVMTFVGLIAIDDSNGQRIKLLRYAEALRQILRDYRDLGESNFDIDPSGMTVTYYPTNPDIGVGVATIRFRVMQDIPN